MRFLITLLVSLAFTASAHACDCFSPEQRLKAAEDALAKAQLAVVGRVITVEASGIVQVRVLESFKGAVQGAMIEARQDFGLCTGPAKGQTFTAGEETFILSFGPTARNATACDKLATDNFLLESIRFIVRGR